MFLSDKKMLKQTVPSKYQRANGTIYFFLSLAIKKPSNWVENDMETKLNWNVIWVHMWSKTIYWCGIANISDYLYIHFTNIWQIVIDIVKLIAQGKCLMSPFSWPINFVSTAVGCCRIAAASWSKNNEKIYILVPR